MGLSFLGEFIKVGRILRRGFEREERHEGKHFGNCGTHLVIKWVLIYEFHGLMGHFI